jgi:uncharacterized protein YigE (DUF2233 family)
MPSFRQPSFVASIILALVLSLLGEPVAISAEYKNITFHQASFTVAKIDLKKDALRLFWKNPTTNQAFISIAELKKWLGKTGYQLEMATNAGIYEVGNTPLGLYIEDGKVLIPLNQKKGLGNFYLKPNGVFVMGDRQAAILESSQFSSIVTNSIEKYSYSLLNASSQTAKIA